MRVLALVWALPVSLAGLGFVLAAALTGGRVARVAGVIEAHGGAVAMILRRLVPLRGGASAMTLGHVVLGRDPASLERTRAHERVHVRQYERWGVFFLPAYALASLVAAARGRHYYRDNRFEREAVAGAAGVTRRPAR